MRNPLSAVDVRSSTLGALQQLLVQAGSLRVPIYQDLQQTLTFGANITVDIALGCMGIITQTSNAVHTVDAPTLGGAAIPAATLTALAGARLTLRFRNTSGGAAGATTFAAIYKIQGGAWTNAATANSRAIVLQCDGTNWVEVSRNAADVPN